MLDHNYDVIRIYLCDSFVGAAVVQSYDVPSVYSAYDSIFNAMGFNDPTEFILSYPGNCIGRSSIVHRSLKKSGTLQKNTTDINYNWLIRSYTEHNPLYLGDLFIDTLNRNDGSILVQPDFESAKMCDDDFGRVHDEYLWFCKDWSEPNEFL